MSYGGSLNNGGIMSKTRAGIARTRRGPTSDPKKPKPKKESFLNKTSLIYNSKTKKFRTGSNPGKNEKRAKIDLRAGTIDFGD